MTNAFDVATAATKARSTMVGRRVIIGTDGRAPFVLDGVGASKTSARSVVRPSEPRRKVQKDNYKVGR